MSETWSRNRGSGDGICIECGEPALEKRRVCASCRAVTERAARVARMAEMRKKPCAESGCTSARAETPTQVRSYCLEHHNEKTRGAETKRRRAAGAEERVVRTPPAVAEGLKWCWGCDEVKSFGEFHFDKGKSDGFQTKCKVCQYDRYQERLAEDPEKVRAIARASQKRHRRRRIYGMDEDQFIAKLAEQGGLCPGCERPPSRPVIDHDHGCCGPNKACEKCVRWILCSPCNSVLGFAEDDAGTLTRLADLLRTRDVNT